MMHQTSTAGHRALRSFLLVPLAALPAILAACGGGGGDSTPPPPTGPVPVAAVVIHSAPQQPLNVGETVQLTAVTTSASGGVLSGRAVSWTSSADAIGSVSGAGTVTALAAGSTLITASSEGKSASVTIHVSAAPQVSDISIISAIWTQGTQDPGDPMPMVAGAAAVLNVYLERAGVVSNPGRITLVVSDGSGAVVHLDSVAAPVPSTSQPGFGSPETQFLLPAALVQPGMYWQVVRDRGGVAPDDSAANDLYPRFGPVELATATMPVMRLRFVPIVLSAHGDVAGNVHDGNVEEYLRSFRAIHPPGRLDVEVRPPFTTSTSFGIAPSGGGTAFWVPVLQELDVARVVHGAEPDAYWYGIVRPPPGYNFTQFGGFGFIPLAPQLTGPGTRTALSVAVNWFGNQTQSRELVAHELGHNMGRAHSPCGNPAGVDQLYPFPNGHIGIAGHDVHSWAAGQSTRAATVTGATGDVMGYCLPMWSSVYTYRAFLTARLTNPGPALMMPRPRERVMVVRGSVDGGVVTIAPSISLTGVAASDPDGDLTIELVDRDGRVMRSVRTRAATVSHAPVRLFTAAIPMDVAAEQRLHEIRVRDARGVRARRVAAPALPAAALTAMVRRSGGRTHASCPSSSEAIAVTARGTGELLALGRGASISVATTDEVSVTCSDGVVSRSDSPR
jgi:hypothetical protein